MEATSTPVTVPPETPPITAVIGQVETDRFCACGYNLHGQRVWRDRSLGILVCRCAECGRHHPAEKETIAAWPWLRRAAIVLTGLYVAAILGMLAGGAGLMIILDAAGSHEMIPRIYEAYARFRSMPVNSSLRSDALMEVVLPLLAIAGMRLAYGVAVGLVASVFCYFLSRRTADRFFWLITLVSLVGLAVALLDARVYRAPGVNYAANFYMLRGFYDLRFMWVMGSFILTLAGFIVAAQWGRKFTRMFLRVFVAPRALPMFGFLWTRDGIVPPRPIDPLAMRG